MGVCVSFCLSVVEAGILFACGWVWPCCGIPEQLEQLSAGWKDL